MGSDEPDTESGLGGCDLVSSSGFHRAASLYTWRSALLNRGGITPDDADELQSHLEEVEAGLLESLEPEEAFWVAAHRVGSPDALTREFGKIQANTGWLLRAQWALLGILAYIVLMPVAQLLVNLLIVVVAGAPALLGPAGFLQSISGLLSLLLLIGILVLIFRTWGGQPESFEKALHSHGLPQRWLFGLAFVAYFLIVRLVGMPMVFLNSHIRELLTVAGQPAPLQSIYWYYLADVLSYAMPALAVLWIYRLQLRRVRG